MDGFPGVRCREDGRSVRPADLHQTTADCCEDPLLGEYDEDEDEDEEGQRVDVTSQCSIRKHQWKL